MSTALIAPETKPKKSRSKKPVFEAIVETKGRRVLNCNLCPKLCGSRTQIVNGYGPRFPRVAIIAEAPGETEDDRGRPLIGPAGQTLRNWLLQVGLDPDADVYYDNAVRCRPENNRTPTPKEIRNCNEHLMRALKIIEPDIIVAAGNSAMHALLPPEIAAEGITKVRGHIFWHEELQRKIVPMFHPSASFHDFGTEIFCLADLKKAVKESKHPTEYTDGMGEYTTLWTVEDVERECKRMRKSDLVVYDTETSHEATVKCEDAGDKGALDWRTAQVLCVGLTDEIGRGWVVPLVGKHFRQIWTPEEMKRVLAALRRLLESNVPKIAQNGKFDVHMLRMLDIYVNEFIFDTMIGYSFIHESASHALEPMRSLFTNMAFYDGSVYEQTDGKSHMEWAEEADLHKYCGADVDCTFRVAKEVDLLLDAEGEDVRWVFENVAMPLQAAVTHIEERGVMIDMELAGRIIEETDKLIKSTEEEFYGIVPQDFKQMNYGSWQQKQKLLYQSLKLPLPPVLTKSAGTCHACRNRKTQHWYHTSTNKEALKELLGAHPVIAPLRTLTQLHTLKKTFLLGEDVWDDDAEDYRPQEQGKKGKRSGLLHHVGPDQRIHTSYNVGFVETGRLSSSPNLQNIPNETDDRPEVYGLIRKLFIAPPGRKLVEVDYSQLELRVLAYVSGEAEMIKQFEANADFHTFTARTLLWPELDPELSEHDWKATHKDYRTRAKTVNFGIPYGLTAFGLAQRLGTTEEVAQKIINAFMGYFTRVRRYFHVSDRDLKYRGERKNALGRKRHFFGVRTMQHYGGYKKMMGHIKREAYNYPIQSTGSDILSLATIAIDHDPWFEDHDCWMVLSVHDSVMFETPDEMAEECAERALEHFESAGRDHLGWYLPGEAKCGQRWSEWAWTMEPNSEREYHLEMKKAA